MDGKKTFNFILSSSNSLMYFCKLHLKWTQNQFEWTRLFFMYVCVSESSFIVSCSGRRERGPAGLMFRYCAALSVWVHTHTSPLVSLLILRVTVHTYLIPWFLSRTRLWAFLSTKHSRQPVYKMHYKDITKQSEFPYNTSALFSAGLEGPLD